MTRGEMGLGSPRDEKRLRGTNEKNNASERGRERDWRERRREEGEEKRRRKKMRETWKIDERKMLIKNARRLYTSSKCALLDLRFVSFFCKTLPRNCTRNSRVSGSQDGRIKNWWKGNFTNEISRPSRFFSRSPGETSWPRISFSRVRWIFPLSLSLFPLLYHRQIGKLRGVTSFPANQGVGSRLSKFKTQWISPVSLADATPRRSPTRAKANWIISKLRSLSFSLSRATKRIYENRDPFQWI